MEKEDNKPSALELIVSFVLTFFSIAALGLLSGCVVGYYTSSMGNALLVFTTGLIVASIVSSIRFWILDRW